ncbi:MAG: glutamine--tRNA ligase/YqeY domain fusion protein [SAR202 cluster bacterium]|nr:glutamine--tRNA ligase [Chloroflexota bacterium]MQG38523.1 glutamine--tRNA ligase/YqeY domain fusion protein [SAR202 cluster bacterium]|tara:strand:- start:4518 stop:6203 length:1686 start_codon:yes stop_codon:yes gene_type:complete
MDHDKNTNTNTNFIKEIITKDLVDDSKNDAVITRFPPEPNGYLHIGHAKSITLNFGLADDFNGVCNLRFDDTNPTKENTTFVDSIKNDIEWLGWNSDNHLYFASDYFPKLYEFAVTLIKSGKAYVDDLTQEQIREFRGTLINPGKESPYRERSVEENLNLFEGMKEGKYEEGSRVLRAKIDMQSGNLNMRDPVLYRIIHTEHHRTKNKWCIYPMYDFAHGQCDSIEKVTHSICTLEFEDHRELYDWILDELKIHHPKQIEFARLNLSFTVLSKRKLMKLVEENHVEGWDDPRMPTLSGLRRRGYTSDSIKQFCTKIGVAKRQNTIDISLLEHSLREDLNKKSQRALAVLNPLKVTIENYPENQIEYVEAINNPEDVTAGHRKVPFTKEIYIDRNDFMVDPPRKFNRLTLGSEVRLKYAYFITCTKIINNPKTGEVDELICTYDPNSKGGKSPDGRKVRGTIHWVSKSESIKSEVRIYNPLFLTEKPDESTNFLLDINPNSIEVLNDCYIEPNLSKAKPGDIFQFERLGYFCIDSKDSKATDLVFNRSVPLKDSWSKINQLK